MQDANRVTCDANGKRISLIVYDDADSYEVMGLVFFTAEARPPSRHPASSQLLASCNTHLCFSG